MYILFCFSAPYLKTRFCLFLNCQEILVNTNTTKVCNRKRAPLPYAFKIISHLHSGNWDTPFLSEDPVDQFPLTCQR